MSRWKRLSICLYFLSLNLHADTTPLTYHLKHTALQENDPLAMPVKSYHALHLPVATALLSLSRSYPITIIADPLMTGFVSLEMKSVTLRDVLDAISESQGGSWEKEGNLIHLHHTQQCFYEIDYPQMTRSAQGSSSVVLSAQANPGINTGGTSNLSQQTAAGANTQSDQTNLSIQQQNQTTFWNDVLSELNSLVLPGETVALNKLAGLALISAPKPRQKMYKEFITLLNKRISRQVRITAKILEVNLDDQHQLGVDWSIAAEKINGLKLTNLNTTTSLSGLLSPALSHGTISGTLSSGQVTAAVAALSEQGSVKSESNPSIVTLGNQTAFVKVGTEQTFFSLTNATSISGLVAQAGINPTATTQNNYTQNAITIGTVLYVTPEINSDGSVTVDVLPAITQLTGVDTSPDGLQTAPRMDIKALSTMAKLHPNESIVIGGLIQNSETNMIRKTPGLSSLPALGNLFKNTSQLKTRSELVIFLSADVLP